MRALVAALFLLLATAAAAALPRDGADGAEARAITAAGGLALADSRGGEAIFAAADLAPGQSASGTVAIANQGEKPGEAVLSQMDVVDSPGAGEAALSEQLLLTVRDLSAADGPATVYSGPLAPMPPQQAGLLAPGAARTYEFVVTLPARSGGSGENELQGASVSVGYRWTAREVTADGGDSGNGGEAARSESVLSADGAAAPLRLRLLRVGHVARRGRVMVWARCDRPCRVFGRGWPARRGPLRSGARRLRIHLPRRAAQRLRTEGGRRRLRFRFVIRGRDAAGAEARVRRRAWAWRRPGLPPAPGRR